jgi:putative ABC transport system permease protein
VLAIGELPLVKNVSPEFMQEASIVYGNKQSSHLVRGVAASYGVMRAEKPQDGGRFLDEEDVRLRRRVAFIGTEVQRKLLSGIPPVGQTIRIAGQPFELVGVLEEKVQLSNYNRPDKYIFIPWTTMSALADTRYVGTFVWQAVSPLLEPKACRSRSCSPNGIATTRPTSGR